MLRYDIITCNIDDMDILLTATEVATWARITNFTVARLARQGDLSGQKLGKEWRFTIDAVRSWSGFADLTVEDVKAASAPTEPAEIGD